MDKLKEQHYRFCEKLLNDFKNKRITYSEFIDSSFNWFKERMVSREKVKKDIMNKINAAGGIGNLRHLEEIIDECLNKSTAY